MIRMNPNEKLNPELSKIIGLFDEQKQEYLTKEILDNLNEKSQKSLSETVLQVLGDELAFLIEVEIRRQNMNNSN